MQRAFQNGTAGRLFSLILFGLAILAGCGSPSGQATDEDPLVRTTVYGTIRGTQWDPGTLAWLGVPYASPPVGELRWKAPRNPAPWNGVREAKAFSSPCSQLGGFLGYGDPDTFGKPIGSEDCLYLNIWRPANGETGLPVFLYIHGGMNSVGQSATSLYHGANLSAKANAVVVTLNYRLGPLGFLYHRSLGTGDPLDDSGNYGLLDCIEALEWIQKNIRSFGGNPDSVTVGGESAGAFDVCSLLGSPLAQGRFHRAIAMSPAGTVTTNTMDQAQRASQGMLVRMLMADEDDPAATPREARRRIREKGDAWAAAYLRGSSPSALLNSSTKFSSLGMNEMGLLLLLNRLADGTVIPEDFKERFERGEYNRVPLLIGSNAEEYKMFLFTGILPPKFVKQDEKDLFEIIRTFDPETQHLAVSDFIRPAARPLYELTGRNFGKLMFDSSIEDLVDRLVPHQDVFVYRFSWNEQPAPFDFLLGSGHMMAIPFFFGNFLLDRDSLFRIAWSEDNRAGREALSETMMGTWANFMWTGDPNAGPFQVPHWEASNKDARPDPMPFDTHL